ncbi:MAG: hypothetical protein WBW31_20985, partial [Candidatus Sulfotelmatobacter sp.]
MLERLRCFLVARFRFPGYEPQPVSIRSVSKWVGQFEKQERRNLPALLKHIKYVGESETKDTLVRLNGALLDRLRQAGIPPKKVIYVQVDDAGSSSPFMLGILKNAARLERLGCTFVDSRDVRGLQEATDRIEEGAIIYVDDFAGTGRQFCTSRDFVAEYVVGNFAEFFLLPYICEEAVQELQPRGIEPITAGIHLVRDRALRPESDILPAAVRQQLAGLCSKVDAKFGLGYRNLGSMIVYYRNAPNGVPL